jgi:hypothetical protein
VVSILLASDDNEYRIFESLNRKGMRLTQADLLRNYIFMSLPHEQQDDVYNKLWLPLQIQFRDHEGRLEDFFRHELQCKGVFVRESDVYTEWKSDLTGKSPTALISILGTLSQESLLFLRLVDPQREPHTGVAERLRRLNRWGAETIFPLLLNIYKSYAAEKLSPEGFIDILATIESFLVRRFFAGVPTNQLNKLFLALFRQLPSDIPIAQAIRTILSEPSRRWPTDDEFSSAIQRFPLYQNGRAEQRRLIIETFAKKSCGREIPDLSRLAIEHILPQNLTNAWHVALERTERRPLHEFQNEVDRVT